jgi:hypothetical protein
MGRRRAGDVARGVGVVTMALTAQQIEARTGKLTASRVACLMTADETKIMDLWREMTGDPTFQPEDLSGVWPVQLGVATEALNLAWFERKHGAVVRQGEVAVDLFHEWAAATLDGWSVQYGCPVECKHVGGREPLERIIERYEPQMQWQMLVTSAEQCALSVIMGADEPVIEFVPHDADYARELLSRAQQFMECVWSRTAPVALPAVAAPVRPTKTYDMTGSNSWASHAATWIETYAAKQAATAAEKEIKLLVPDDAVLCHGHGVSVKRDKAGRLSLRQMEVV